MTSRDQLWAALQRAKALSDRNTADICQRIQSRKGLERLDALFDESHRLHVLYMRIYARYEATLGGDAIADS